MLATNKAVSALAALALCMAQRGETSGGAHVIAYHRLCCVQSDPVELPIASGDLVTDWTLAVSRFDGLSCVNTFGVGEVCYEKRFEKDGWPPADHKAKWAFQAEYSTIPSSTTAAQDDDSDGDNGDGDATHCAAVEVMVRGANPSKSVIDFFEPDFLEELSDLKPSVRIETGIGSWKSLSGGLKNFEIVSGRMYKYHEAYGFEDRKLITEEQISAIVTKELIEVVRCNRLRSQSDGLASFFEYATNTRSLSESEARLLFLKEQLDHVLTLDMLDEIDVSKKLKNLKKKMAKIAPENCVNGGDNWLRCVPVQILIPKFARRGGMRKRYGPYLGRKGYNKRIPGGRDTSTVDLSLLKEVQFDQIVTLMRDKQSHRELRSASKSTSLPQEIVPRRDAELDKTTPTMITDYLLTKSLLAGGGTTSAKVIKKVLQEKLEQTRSPLLSICSPRLVGRLWHWSPEEMSKLSFAEKFEFAADGPLTVSYAMESLQGVNMGDGIAEDESPLDVQCVVLALMNVTEDQMDSLTRQPLDVGFVVILRRNVQQDGSVERIPTLETRQANLSKQVDLWEVFQGDSKVSIGELFEGISQEIRQTSCWPREEPEREEMESWLRSRHGLIKKGTRGNFLRSSWRGSSFKKTYKSLKRTLSFSR